MYKNLKVKLDFVREVWNLINVEKKTMYDPYISLYLHSFSMINFVTHKRSQI